MISWETIDWYHTIETIVIGTTTVVAVWRWIYWKRRSIRIERAYGGILKRAAIVSARGPAPAVQIGRPMEQRSALN